MKAIRVVVGERQRIKQALLKERQQAERREERRLLEGRAEALEDAGGEHALPDGGRGVAQDAKKASGSD